MLRREERLKGVKEIVGVAHVTVQRWERWDYGGYINRPTLLNSAERVFAEVQRWVEGRRYERIEAKQAAVEAVLRRLEAEAKVSSLVERPYIRQALNASPS
jgi:hypothetical protein